MGRTLEKTRPEAPQKEGPRWPRRAGYKPPDRPAAPPSPPRPHGRRRIALLAALAVVAGAIVLIVRGGEASPPPDRAADFVRSSALAYVHVSTDGSSEQWRRAEAMVAELPTLQELRDRLLGQQVNGISLQRDARPWLGGEAAYALVPLGGKEPQPLLLLEARDRQAAERSLNRRSAGAAVPHRGTRIHTVGDGAAAAYYEGFVIAGERESVRRAIDVRAGATPSLAGHEPYTRLRGDLPAERLVHGWLSRSFMREQIAGPAALLAGAARAEGLDAGAFSFGLDGERARLAFRGDASADSRRATGCEGAADGGSLLSKGPSAPTALLGLDGLQCLVRDVIAAPSGSDTGAGLRGFLEDVQRTDKIDLERELLPLLKGESELTLTEQDENPVLSAAIDGVDGRRALDVLGRLQPALIRLVDPERLGSAAEFSSRRIAGEPALTAELSPALQLSYAAFDGKLVASTAPKGIEDAKNGDGPEESDDFEAVLGDRPKDPSALVFADFDKLLALGDRVGLAEVPAYLAVRDDLQKLGALGAVVSREEEAIKAELLFRTP